jgi:hypothetical protein
MRNFYISVTMNDQAVNQALVDTDATISAGNLDDKKIMCKKVYPLNIRVNGAGSNRINAKGWCPVNVQISSRTVSIRLYILSRDGSSIILGEDFIEGISPFMMDLRP